MDLFESRIRTLLGIANKETQDTIRKKKIERATELYEWAVNDDENIIKGLKKRLSESGLIDPDTFKRFPSWNYINGIPKMLNIICTVYHKSPKRYVTVNGREDEKATELLNKYIENTNINEAYSEALKFAWLYKIMRVMPVLRDSKFEFDVLLPFQTEIDTEKGKPFKVVQIGILNEEWNGEKFDRFIIVWNSKEHYLLDSNLDPQPIANEDGNTNDFVNPYGMIPIGTLYLEPTDVWGDPQYKLVEHFISNSLKNIWKDYVSFFHAGGIPVLSNTDIEDNRSTERENSVNDEGQIIIRRKLSDSKVRISPDSALLLNSNDGKDAKFAFESPQSNLELVQNCIDWDIKKNLSDYNIPKNAYEMEKTAVSGYSKMIDEIEIINTRKKHLAYCLNFENEMFEVLKKLIEVEFGEKFPDNSKLKIDFAELEFPKSQDELTKEMDASIKYGIKSPIDYIIDNNPELSRDKAELLFKENLEINSAISGQKGISLTLEEKPNILELPDLRQYSDFDCGVSVTQGILAYYGIDSTESELISEMKIDPNWGTEPKQIETLMQNRGLEVVSKQMTLEEIKSYIDQRTPVILDIQAWDENPDVDYETTKEDGHYVIAIGYDDDGFIFEDPSWTGLAKLSYDELLKRWHDIDANNNELRNWGIAVIGTPKYTRSKYVEIG